MDHFSGCQLCTQQSKDKGAYRECEAEFLRSYEFAAAALRELQPGPPPRNATHFQQLAATPYCQVGACGPCQAPSKPRQTVMDESRATCACSRQRCREARRAAPWLTRWLEAQGWHIEQCRAPASPGMFCAPRRMLRAVTRLPAGQRKGEGVPRGGDRGGRGRRGRGGGGGGAAGCGCRHAAAAAPPAAGSGGRLIARRQPPAACLAPRARRGASASAAFRRRVRRPWRMPGAWS